MWDSLFFAVHFCQHLFTGLFLRFVMADQQQQLKDMRNTVAAYAKKKQHVDTFSCSVCGRVYKYSKAKDQGRI